MPTFRRRLHNTVSPLAFPLLSRAYKSYWADCPWWLLESTGIYHPETHKHFATLCGIIGLLDDFNGAIAECGVYRGQSLLGIAHRMRLKGREDVPIYGFDSFEGFPAPTSEDAVNGTYSPEAQQGRFGDTRYDDVLARVRRLGFDNVHLVRGYFEDTLPSVSDLSFQLVHLDCDLYQSYLTCLEFFYPRTVSGGYIVFDEYSDAAATYPGAQKAIDSFFADKPEMIERFASDPQSRYFVRKL